MLLILKKKKKKSMKANLQIVLILELVNNFKAAKQAQGKFLCNE